MHGRDCLVWLCPRRWNIFQTSSLTDSIHLSTEKVCAISRRGHRPTGCMRPLTLLKIAWRRRWHWKHLLGLCSISCWRTFSVILRGTLPRPLTAIENWLSTLKHERAPKIRNREAEVWPVSAFRYEFDSLHCNPFKKKKKKSAINASKWLHLSLRRKLKASCQWLASQTTCFLVGIPPLALHPVGSSAQPLPTWQHVIWFIDSGQF